MLIQMDKSNILAILNTDDYKNKNDTMHHRYGGRLEDFT